MGETVLFWVGVVGVVWIVVWGFLCQIDWYDDDRERRERGDGDLPT